MLTLTPSRWISHQRSWQRQQQQPRRIRQLDWRAYTGPAMNPHVSGTRPGATDSRSRAQKHRRLQILILRDHNTPNLHPQFVWRPYSLEDGQDYVRFTNWGRCLRANGPPYDELPITHRVTVHRKVTRMTEWRVETIPPSPVSLPLPPPPPRRVSSPPASRRFSFQLLGSWRSSREL